MLTNRIIQRESVVHRLLKIAVCFVVQLSIAQSNSAFPQVQNLPYEPHKMGIQYQIGDLDNITSTIYNGRGDGVLFPQESNPTTPVQISFYVGLEGSKQPQDFGANANVGGRFRANISGPLFEQHGIGYQIGTALVTSATAFKFLSCWVLQKTESRALRHWAFSNVTIVDFPGVSFTIFCFRIRSTILTWDNGG